MHLTREFLQKEYVENERSPYDIAESLGIYPNKVRRALQKHGIVLRDKSKAQSTALKTGRHEHPTKGRKRSEEEKIRISEGRYRAWQKMSLDERNLRVLQAKQQWAEMGEDKQEQLRKLAAEAVRKAAEEGSKLEKFLLLELKRRKYVVEFHKTTILPNEKLHLDLFLPELKTAIEIDGPAHFFPIWGEENLAKHLIADNAKTGLVLELGYALIRVKNLSKDLSEIHKRELLTKVVNLLESINNNFPPREQRLIEVEVK